ncbi:glycoside hydrolase family 30 protein [Algoriphagus zhangzhouensis]|uniref:Glucosylceramidase n=1 Tax=Algoriphagus zhangzhouensis TaxID=1073327 RepID=A0A1M7Z714_9BACT|nr:glycoside hydrolase family 30 beta sandwich domain-containing protein [Algoriphagus zhangzhouensis]TDY49246.1 glucosylceramidase [Algoriphagus zhangzhouensis]SHO60655.1 glucosylceramidase [Algoriphagus zhangzhouensis]
MKKIYLFLLLPFLACTSEKPNIELWLTEPEAGILFQKQEIEITDSSPNEILIDPETTYQSMDGFGYTLSQGSAQHLLQMSDSARSSILNELFSEGENNIRISYLRLSVAASDLNEFPFSYDDLEDSLAIDPNLEHFSLSYDTLDVIPVLKEILSINPDIQLMASPWSPPSWMKDNKDTRGGSLLEEYEPKYVDYLVKYIQEMEKLGIEIDALTIQNEPLHPGNNPSLLMLPEQQARFIGMHLGPAFQEAGITTKIIVYDHNADRPDYPITVLEDSLAYPFIDGSAFHLYGGEIEALSEVHQAFPDKNIYFTEQWVGAPGNLPGDLSWHVKNLVIGGSRNWAKTVLEWNLSSNPALTPHTDRGGCDRCLGAITIDGDQITRNPAYYIIAHASKFVDPGSVRIDSSEPEGLANVAFERPDGKKVLIVLNESSESKPFQIKEGDQSFSLSLNPGAVGTFVWK